MKSANTSTVKAEHHVMDPRRLLQFSRAFDPFSSYGKQIHGKSESASDVAGRAGKKGKAKAKRTNAFPRGKKRDRE